MIALDSNALSLLFVPGAIVHETGTDKPVRWAKERMELLVEQIAQNGDQILIPTPALCEILAKTPDASIQDVVAELTSSSWYRVEAFDLAAAIELGKRTASAIAAGDKREGSSVSWTKIKFDRQILAIAIVCGASEIISNDPDIRAQGLRWEFLVKGVEDLPVPPKLVPPPLLAPLEDN